jgi:tetratricopeptide (TPR) repeat protein
MDDHENLLNSAFRLHQSGQVREALGLYNEILPRQPNNTRLLYLAGTANLQIGQMEQGIALIQRSLAINPDNPLAHNNVGRAQLALKRPDEALASYDRALAIQPDYAEAHYNRGAALRECRRLDEALASYDAALAIKPDFAEAHNQRGNVLHDLQRLDEALASCDKALALDPGHAGAHCNRGIVLRELKRPEEALASYDAALAINPHYAEAHNNRGVALQECMRLDESLASFDRAIADKPDYAKAYCNKSYALLLNGDLEQGWKLLEWRFKGEKRTEQFSQPVWLGAESLEGKTILLHAEEGIGDAIQFCRYAKAVSDLGARVFLEVQKPLASLLRQLDGVSAVIERGQPRPAFDYHCPLLSLPLAFRTTLASIPHPTAYLRTDDAKARHWQGRIGGGSKLKVGLAWSGGLRHKPEWRHINETRNIPLAVFSQGLNAVDADFFSLQKGEQAEAEIGLRQQDYWPGGNFHNFMDEDKELSDTAAIIANLDVVLSVDTSIAHLSAALGKPTWIPLKFDNDWRWLVGREDSPWYRSVKLYRQGEDRLWQPVLGRVASDLAKLAAARRPLVAGAP